MAQFNLGNVVGLIKSETAPSKKYVLWGEIINPSFPDIVNLKWWDENASDWVLINTAGPTYWHEAVIDNTLTSPPGSPSEGDRYMIPDSASGAWAGNDQKLTEYQASTWTFYTPKPGDMVMVLSDPGSIYEFTGTWGSGGLWNDRSLIAPEITETLQESKIRVSSATILTLTPANPVQLLAAPGAGIIRKIISIALLKPSSGYYNANAFIRYAGNSDDIAIVPLTSGNGKFYTPTLGSYEELVNTAINIEVNEAITSGTAVIDIITHYIDVENSGFTVI